jgi:hypothetical protein
MDHKQAVALAHTYVKTYFKNLKEPSWTGKYQLEYPIFVENFVTAYLRQVKQEKKKQITDNSI